MLNIRKVNEKEMNKMQVRYNAIINKWEIMTKENLKNFELAYKIENKNVYYCNTSELNELPYDADLITY